MASFAGKAPWEREPWEEGFRRITKRGQKSQGVEWSLTSGWRYKPDNYWWQIPHIPKMRRIRLYNGRTVRVPIDDYQDFIGHHKSESSDPDSEIGKYIYKAFEEQKDKLQHVDGVGHITLIEYSPTYQLMQVTFTTDGAVVVFFRVPKEVYSELKYLAESKTTFIDAKGIERHNLGKRFWDIVRIRGQRTGSKYRYEYVTQGIKKGSVTQQAAASYEKEAAEKGTLSNDISILDGYAKNFLTGSLKKEYDALKTYAEKEAFLKKAGIL